MKTYEVWIVESAGALTTRIISVRDFSEVAAYQQAQRLHCQGTEFIRGVIEVPVASWS